MSLIVISFDGVKDTEFEKMAANARKYPNIARFAAAAQYTGNVYTTFVSNTYPIHSSVSTGRHPKEHGIISNILSHKNGAEVWAQEAALIKSPTIFTAAAAAKGLKVGAVAWPVTCSAKIKWNLPEVHLLPGQSRLRENFRHGSAVFQVMALLRHGKKLDGLKQPQLDDFFTSVAVDLLRDKKPDLAMLHLLAYDDLCHEMGICDELDIARAAMGHNLGRILDIAEKTVKDAAILVFSDHGHLNVSQTIDLTADYGDVLHEQCGGCAFFTHKIEGLEKQPWFGRPLTDEEMDISGYSGLAGFGFAAARGASFDTRPHRANHGYPRDYDDYRVFFAIKNGKRRPYDLPFDDIRNVTAIINQELGLDMAL